MIVIAPTESALPSAPGFVASKSRLDRLRKRRATRAIANAIYNGQWRKVLLDAQKSQHRFRKTLREGGKIETLLEKVNLVARAMDLQADIIACDAPSIIAPEENADQSRAIDSIRRRSLFDALFHDGVLTAIIEGEAPMRVNVTAKGETVVALCDPDETLPVGELGPDGQPQVWERRWLIERKDRVKAFGKSTLYLRIERHWAPDGVGVVDQEAYETVSRDVLLDLSSLRRVPLADAIPSGLPIPPERIETGAAYAAIVQFVTRRRKGEPNSKINENTLDLIDASAAQFSSISRMMELHGSPRVRIPSDYVDDKGDVRAIDTEAIVDPNKEFEYITIEMKFDSMIGFLDKLLFILFIELEGSPALIGLRQEGSGAITSAAQLRIESTGSLAAAKRSVPYLSSALERLFEIAGQIDSQLPLRGYAVAPVSAIVKPDIPLSPIDKAREQNEMLVAGLTSRRRAVAAIHGEDQAEQILSEIETDQDAQTQRDQTSIFGAVPSLDTGDGGAA